MIWIFMICKKIKKTIIEYRTRCYKNCFQKTFLESSEFLENKITDAVTKPNNDKVMKNDENPKGVKK